jgi:hypothetical protein
MMVFEFFGTWSFWDYNILVHIFLSLLVKEKYWFNLAWKRTILCWIPPWWPSSSRPHESQVSKLALILPFQSRKTFSEYLVSYTLTKQHRELLRMSDTSCFLHFWSLFSHVERENLALRINSNLGTEHFKSSSCLWTLCIFLNTSLVWTLSPSVMTDFITLFFHVVVWLLNVSVRLMCYQPLALLGNDGTHSGRKLDHQRCILEGDIETPIYSFASWTPWVEQFPWTCGSHHGWTVSLQAQK